MEQAEADAGDDAVVPRPRHPLARMLLLSLALHGAVLMIVQPREFPPVVDDTVVIAARLLEPEPAPVPEPLSEPEPELLPVEPEPVQPEPLAEALPDPVPVKPAAESAPVLPPPAKAPTEEPKPAPAKPVAPEPAPVTAEKVPARIELPSIPVLVDTQWYELKKADRPPQRLTPLDTTYPPGPYNKGIEGRVKVKLWINEYGELTDTEVVESQPPGVFDAAALAAVRKSRYKAAEKDGRPIRVISYSVISYTLTDD